RSASTASVNHRSKLTTKFIFKPIETKNRGAKILLINWWTISLALSDICSESPSAIPNKNAPKIAWIPNHSVKAAARKQKAIDRDSTPPGQASFLLIHGKTLLIMAFPTVNIKKVKTSVMPMVCTKEKLDPFPIKDNMTEKINQPIMSLTMAEATINIPILDLNISVSINIRTTTGRAVMDMAVPINRENNSLSPAARPKKSGKKYGKTNPRAKGIIKPSVLMLKAAFPWDQIK